MATRTTRRTVTFQHPFFLRGIQSRGIARVMSIDPGELAAALQVDERQEAGVTA